METNEKLLLNLSNQNNENNEIQNKKPEEEELIVPFKKILLKIYKGNKK